jgi:hypothetical protein
MLLHATAAAPSHTHSSMPSKHSRVRVLQALTAVTWYCIMSMTAAVSHFSQVALATLLASHSIVLKSDHPVPVDLFSGASMPDAVHITLSKL